MEMLFLTAQKNLMLVKSRLAFASAQDKRGFASEAAIETGGNTCGFLHVSISERERLKFEGRRLAFCLKFMMLPSLCYCDTRSDTQANEYFLAYAHQTGQLNQLYCTSPKLFFPLFNSYFYSAAHL